MEDDILLAEPWVTGRWNGSKMLVWAPPITSGVPYSPKKLTIKRVDHEGREATFETFLRPGELEEYGMAGAANAEVKVNGKPMRVIQFNGERQWCHFRFSRVGGGRLKEDTELVVPGPAGCVGYRLTRNLTVSGEERDGVVVAMNAEGSVANWLPRPGAVSVKFDGWSIRNCGTSYGGWELGNENGMVGLSADGWVLKS